MADFLSTGRDLEVIKAALKAHAADLGRYFFDEPSAKYHSDWRFGTHGSISVIIAGPKAGLFYDYESGKGGDLFDLIMHCRGGCFPDAKKFATEFLGGSISVVPARKPSAREKRDRREQRETIEIAARLWGESTDPHGALVESYLAARGLTLPDEIAGGVLRYHRALTLDGRHAHGMVALLRDVVSNRPCGIIRTFLDEHGRKIERRMLGQASGAAVKLSPNEEVTQGLHICEGTETGLAAIFAGYRPVWALGSAGAIARFPVLAGIEALTILTERNDGGANERAVAEVSERWQAANCEVFAVEMLVGDDFNDAWREATA